jgi:hypothetical protein
LCSLHTREPAMPENISSTVANGCKDFLRGKCRKSVGAGGQNSHDPITAASGTKPISLVQMKIVVLMLTNICTTPMPQSANTPTPSTLLFPPPNPIFIGIEFPRCKRLMGNFDSFHYHQVFTARPRVTQE